MSIAIYGLKSFRVLRIYFKNVPVLMLALGKRIAYMMMMCYCMTAFESMTLNCFGAQQYSKVC